MKCRLRRQQYKDSLETQVQRLQEQLKKCEEERDFFREFYNKCCGQRHPLNLEMVNNNNHEAGDYKRQNEEDMKIDPEDLQRDVDLNAGAYREEVLNGAYREDRTGKPDERLRSEQLVEELLAAGEDPTALGVGWKKMRGKGPSIRVPSKILREKYPKATKWQNGEDMKQDGRSNRFEAVGELHASAPAVDEEDVREVLTPQGVGS